MYSGIQTIFSKLIMSTALVILILGSPFAHACRPAPDADLFKSPQHNLKKYDFVFLGEIIENTNAPIQPQPTSSKHKGSISAPTIARPKFGKGGIFRILKIYKGTHNKKTIDYKTATHSCGFSASKGTIILLFTNKDNDSVLPLHALTPSRRFNNRNTAITQADRWIKTGE